MRNCINTSEAFKFSRYINAELYSYLLLVWDWFLLNLIWMDCVYTNCCLLMKTVAWFFSTMCFFHWSGYLSIPNYSDSCTLTLLPNEEAVYLTWGSASCCSTPTRGQCYSCNCAGLNFTYRNWPLIASIDMRYLLSKKEIIC